MWTDGGSTATGGGTSPAASPAASATAVSHVGPGSVASTVAVPGVTLWLELAGALLAGLWVSVMSAGGLTWVSLAALACWAIAVYSGGTSGLRRLSGPMRLLWRGTVVTLAFVALLVASGAADRASARASVAAVGACWVVAAYVRWTRERRRLPSRVVLVGDRVAVSQAAAGWRNCGDVNVVGAHIMEPDVDVAALPEDILGAPLLPRIDVAAVTGLHADAVIVAPGPGLTADDLSRWLWELEGAEVSIGVVSVLDAVAAHQLNPERLGERLVMGVAPPHRSAWVSAVKAVTDRLVGAVMVVLTAPLLGLLIAAIRLDSPGGGLFRQTRVGVGGRPFTMYKLRTMYVDAEDRKAGLSACSDADGLLFKMKHDPRITPVGRLLRRTSVDELPQLINVLRGDMSLIGPRPALPEESMRYDPRVRRRLAIKPGMTGLWQINGRSDLSWEQAVALDLHYVDNWRLTDDMLIALRTANAVIRARGAY